MRDAAKRLGSSLAVLTGFGLILFVGDGAGWIGVAAVLGGLMLQ